MPTVRQIVERLLPLGTAARDKPADWQRCPMWPPDVFAVAATLVSRSGCYTQTRYIGGAACDQYFDDAFRELVELEATTWETSGLPSAVVEELWRALVRNDCDVGAGRDQAQPWWDHALELMAIADRASVGIGFVSHGKSSHFRRIYLREYAAADAEQPHDHLPFLPKSLCMWVPPDEACVQPKTVTAQVGCTLRSLSHNLALLPSLGEVTSWWHLGSDAPLDEGAPLNLLLVPFPYRVEGTCFTADVSRAANPASAMRFFRMAQRWLDPTSPNELASFLVDLVETAKAEVQDVHGIVLPEGALEFEQAKEVAQVLAGKTSLELFVSGVFDDSDPDLGTVNGVYSCIFQNGQVLRSWAQSKHHRWQLERSQIQRYHLGHALDPKAIWWERIRVSDRRCVFYVFRRGASLTTLVCEDLARIDPVQAAVRAIGPNLVIALLQDGPQLEKRWPGRYATVLADDPGSAVLTLTSLGMLRRSYMPGEPQGGEVALWKQAYGTAQELRLPRGCQALLLTLSSARVQEWTMDSRSDGGRTVRLALSGVHGVALPRHKRENWPRLHLDEW